MKKKFTEVGFLGESPATAVTKRMAENRKNLFIFFTKKKVFNLTKNDVKQERVFESSDGFDWNIQITCKFSAFYSVLSFIEFLHMFTLFSVLKQTTNILQINASLFFSSEKKF